MAHGGAFSQLLADLTHDVSRASPNGIIVALIVIAAAAVFVGWRAWRSVFEARLIEDTPTSKARSAAQGYVELQGVARAMDGAPTIAPLTGLRCCWYRFLIEEQITRTHQGRTETHWPPSAEQSRA